jgi:hypothetical protein
LSLSKEESRLGKPRPSQEWSMDEEFGSTKNQVGEEIKLSESLSKIKLGVQIDKDHEIESI